MNKLLIWNTLILSVIWGVIIKVPKAAASWSINLADNYIQIGDWTAPAIPESFSYWSGDNLLANVRTGEECKAIATTSNKIRLTWEGEIGGEIKWQGEWRENQGYVDMELAEDGEYTFTWQQRDAAGNESEAIEIQCPLVIDKQKPMSQIISFSEDEAGNLGIYYQIEDAGAAQKEVSVYYRFQTENKDWAGDFMLAGVYENKEESGLAMLDKDLTVREGWYQVVILATDAAGNAEEWPLETAQASVYQVKAKAEGLPTVLVEEDLGWAEQREYIVPLEEEAKFEAVTLNKETAEVVRAENAVIPKLGEKMLRLNGQVATENETEWDAQWRYNTGGFYPRTVTLHYQIISNQPERDLGDIGLVVQVGALGEKTAEIGAEHLSQEKIEGWYRTGWQTIQIAPLPYFNFEVIDMPINGMIKLAMNHDLVAGKEVYIYIDKIEYDRLVLSAHSRIHLQNNQQEEYAYIGYEYSLAGEKIATMSAKNSDVYFQLAQTPDEGKVTVWLENEKDKKTRSRTFEVEIDKEAPRVEWKINKLEQVGEQIWTNYLELESREEKTDKPAQNIIYIAEDYHNETEKSIYTAHEYAAKLKRAILTGRKNNKWATTLAGGQDKMMFFHQNEPFYYEGVFMDTAYNRSSFKLDLERQICIITP